MRNDLDHFAPPKFPAWAYGVVALAIVASWLPLVLIARSRSIRSVRQPIHMFLDMDFQPRYGPQDYQADDLAMRFADGRAMRPAVAGAVRYDNANPGVEP